MIGGEKRVLVLISYAKDELLIHAVSDLREVINLKHTAKLFMNGRSQAVRLPASYRFDCEEVYIRRDPATGDVVISRRPGSWEDYFEMLEDIDVPEDFMADRDNAPPQERDSF